MTPWADMLYICDWAMVNKYHDTSDVDNGMSWTEFPGIKVSQDAQTIRDFPEWHRVPSEHKPGLSLDPLRIHRGMNSGYQALNLAVLLGAKRIVLLGYDMKISKGKKAHWHGDHVSGLNNPQDHNVERWKENFESTLPDLEKAGVAVLNCTRQTALEAYPKVPLEELL